MHINVLSDNLWLQIASNACNSFIFLHVTILLVWLAAKWSMSNIDPSNSNYIIVNDLGLFSTTPNYENLLAIDNMFL